MATDLIEKMLDAYWEPDKTPQTYRADMQAAALVMLEQLHVWYAQDGDADFMFFMANKELGNDEGDAG